MKEEIPTTGPIKDRKKSINQSVNQASTRRKEYVPAYTHTFSLYIYVVLEAIFLRRSKKTL